MSFPPPQPIILSLALSSLRPSQPTPSISQPHFDDPFDQLDHDHHASLASHPHEPPASRNSRDGPPPPGRAPLGPLDDALEWILPGVRIATAREEGAVAPWLEQLSGRVTAVAVTAGAVGPGKAAGHRVILGTKAGVVWILANEPKGKLFSKSTGHSEANPGRTEGGTESTSPPRREGSSKPIQLSSPSIDTYLANSQSTATSANHSQPASASSPPTSPRPRLPKSRQLSFTGRPKLAHRGSSHSVQSRRVTSPTAPTAAGFSYELPTHRARKASATIAVQTGDSPAATPGTPSAAATPARSATPNPPPASNPISSASSSRTSPTLPSVAVLSPSPSTSRTRHRARDSITTGIGLWEHDSVASLALSGQDGWGPSGPGTPGEENEALLEEEEEEEVPSQLDGPLRAVGRVQAGGWGEVVGVEVVQGTRWASEEGGEVVVVLRKNGVLTILSALDGRALGTCDAGARVAGDNQPGSVVFDGFKVLQLGETIVALCHGRTRCGLVVVDLDLLAAQDPVPSPNQSPLQPAVIFKQGIHFLVYPTTLPHDPAQSELDVRPILFDPPKSVAEDAADTAQAAGNEVRIEPVHSAGVLPGLGGAVKGLRNCADDLVAFDDSGALLFTIRDQCVAGLARLDLGGIVDVAVEGYNLVLVTTQTEARFYRLDPSASPSGEGGLFEFKLLATASLAGAEKLRRVGLAGPGANGAGFVVVSSEAGGVRRLERLAFGYGAVGVEVERVNSVGRVELLAGASVGEAIQPERVTCAHKVDRDTVVLGLSSGAVQPVGYDQLDAASSDGPAEALLSAAITTIEVVDVGARRVVLAGAVDGSAGAWHLDDWTALGRWRLFASPVAHIVQLSCPPESVLHGTVAFVSLNSPVGLVSLRPEGPQLLFVLPGTKSGVEVLATKGDDILVMYAEGLARVCDVRGRELRRSMDRRTARGVLREEGWTMWFSIEARRAAPSPSPSPTVLDPLLTFDLRAELEATARLLPWAEAACSPALGTKSQAASPVVGHAHDRCDPLADTRNSRSHLALIRLLFSHVATWGIDAAADALVRDELEIGQPPAALALALHGLGGVAVPNGTGVGAWTVSAGATAHRLVAVVTLLRVFLNFPDTERAASQLILFYTSQLTEAVGPAFVRPGLEAFAALWLDRQAEVREAARMLFGSYLAVCEAGSVSKMVERWDHLLPSRQPVGSPPTPDADLALLFCGLVATENFTLLAPPVLRAISRSVARCLAEDAPPSRQLIGAELSARGFELWQHYVDAPALVRQVCALATGRRAGAPVELRAVGRQAVLRVAGVNPPLFMTTLLHDMGNEAAERRNATLKLLGFLIRKKPLVLYPSLPRIAEAVVLSLDPTVSSLRQTVHQAATVILNELVRTYPFIGFHHRSQRLAVGTQEGSTILYDLKTATRLYVLEGHRCAVTALTFSPDGRRLVSVSLEEGKCVVWKVGGGVWSLFTPGTAPRQGGTSGEKPWKELDFAVGEEGMMTVAATLEWVAFEWPAERTVRLKIRETALTFSV